MKRSLVIFLLGTNHRHCHQYTDNEYLHRVGNNVDIYFKELLFFSFMTASLRSSSSRNSFSHHVFKFVVFSYFNGIMHGFSSFFSCQFPTFHVVSFKMMTIYEFEKNINLFHLSMLESCKQKLSSNILRFQIICFSFLFTLCFSETIQDLGKNKIQN